MSGSNTQLIIVTATYQRANQFDYLERCARALSGVNGLVWLVVEDASQPNPRIDKLAALYNLNICHLSIGPVGDMGNSPKNRALEEIVNRGYEGIIYVADDDNLYNRKLFEVIRETKRVSVFPVGNLGPNGIEKPVVRGGRIVEWDAGWKERKYPLDWAGFAFHSSTITKIPPPILGHKPLSYPRTNSTFQNKTKKEKKDLHAVCCEGESEFLDKIISSKEEFEVLCDDCSYCLVWHNEPLGVVWVLNKLFSRRF